MNLVIVESPAKAKTIEKYLGKDFKVIASVGHIIDLPKKELGVDIENNFKPKYTALDNKKDVIKRIKSMSDDADLVYLAPDPDREGEAIAWHIASQIKKGKPIKRVLFNEITKKGVMDGINNPGEINMNRVNAQQSRRILDRLVGYKVSPILWRPLKRNLSAGRVQSVALRLVCEREVEIENFKEVESWTVDGLFDIVGKTEQESGELKARLDKISGKNPVINNEKEALELLAKLPKEYVISSVEEKQVKQTPTDPFITSKMQQDASRKLGFTAKKTMQVAQGLYEGVELAEGPVGLITYMRTDSTRIAPEAQEEAKKYIEQSFGKEFVSAGKRAVKKSANTQDAHEAIRPTSVMRTPKEVEQYLNKDQFKLYKLIWERFVASQMADALYNLTIIKISADIYEFKTTARVLKFPGFTKLYTESVDEDQKDDKEEENATITFNVVKGSGANLKETFKKQHFSKAPPRFNEGSLIKTLDQLGIGRPSTYASIISTIVDREYVEIKQKRFHPTELGRIVNQVLTTSFPNLFEVEFTANMEKELDLIEEGKEIWTDVLKKFYTDFDKELKEASSSTMNVGLPTNLKCPKCNEDLLIKNGKNGPFLACKSYPDCNFSGNFKRDEHGNIEIIPQEKKEFEKSGVMCEKCGSEMVFKDTKVGPVIACPKYPECKNIKNIQRFEDGTFKVLEANTELDIPCPTCGQKLVLKNGRNGIFAACSAYPKCRFTSSVKMNDEGHYELVQGKQETQTDEVCEKCGKPMVVKRGPRGPFLACSGYPECKNSKPLKKND